MIRVWHPTPEFLEKLGAEPAPEGAVWIALDCPHLPRVVMGVLPKRHPVHAFDLLTGRQLTPAEMDSLGLTVSAERSSLDLLRQAVHSQARHFVKCGCDESFWWQHGPQVGGEVGLTPLCRN